MCVVGGARITNHFTLWNIPHSSQSFGTTAISSLILLPVIGAPQGGSGGVGEHHSEGRETLATSMEGDRTLDKDLPLSLHLSLRFACLFSLHVARVESPSH